MGRKNKFTAYLKPFCYYCDKEFNNEIILHQHQKSRHFSCIKCKKRFSTAPALETHCFQVHREKLTRVPNAKTGREQFDISIYGMDGVPMDLLNIKLQEKVEYKKRKLVRNGEKGIELNNDFDNKLSKKRRNENKDYTYERNNNFYHNPDSINITKTENQKNSFMSMMFPPMNPFMFMNMNMPKPDQMPNPQDNTQDIINQQMQMNLKLNPNFPPFDSNMHHFNMNNMNKDKSIDSIPMPKGHMPLPDQ